MKISDGMKKGMKQICGGVAGAIIIVALFYVGYALGYAVGVSHGTQFDEIEKHLTTLETMTANRPGPTIITSSKDAGDDFEKQVTQSIGKALGENFKGAEVNFSIDRAGIENGTVVIQFQRKDRPPEN